MKVNRERAMAQVAATGLKSAKLEPGTILTLVGIETGERPGPNDTKIPSDTVRFSTEKGLIKVSLGEVLRFTKEDGGSFLTGDDTTADVEIPSKLKISSSTDRVSALTGEKIYPVMAYNAFEKMRDAGQGIDWNKLVESSVRKDNQYAPVQNYVVIEA
jgi:hypothetical protein